MNHVFVIASGEDGISVEQMSEEQLVSRLTENYYGHGVQILNRVPSQDHGCFTGVDERSILVIRGRIVVPQPKQVATTWEIPS